MLCRLQLWRSETIERLTVRIAFRLPRYLVMWCAIRVMAHASQGQWGDESPDRIDMMTMLDRWDRPHRPSHYVANSRQNGDLPTV